MGQRWRRVSARVVVLALALALAGCGASAGPELPGSTAPGQTSTTAPRSADAAEALAALDRLVRDDGVVQADYRRDAFGDDWAYDPSTGCNTREQVLIDESLVPAQVDDRCRPTGRWRSPYDGRETTDRADLQIDHLIPLAEAWRSGAAAWDDVQRRAFANDRSNPDALVAVTGSINESKGDSPPDEWMPPDRSAWCWYAQAWVSVKADWRLTVRPAEAEHLRDVLLTC